MGRSTRSRGAVILAVAAMFAALLVAPMAAVPVARASGGLIPNGPNDAVRAIAANPSDPSITYLGGDFTEWGPQTGGFAVISQSSGDLNHNFPPVAGEVRAIVSDGAGGFYIGGTFTAVAGIPRNNAAHILANGSVDPAWNPDPQAYVETSDGVYAMARVGSDILLGGRFYLQGTGQAQGITRVTPSGVVAYSLRLDAGGGTTCYTGGRPCVRDLMVSDSTVYAVGYFNRLGPATTRHNAAAFDLETGSQTSWNPDVSGTAMSVTQLPDSIAIGGEFETVNGGAYSISNLAAFDTSGTARPDWIPGPNGFVQSMAVGPDGLYVVGPFTSIAGVGRNRAAALSTDTSAAVTPAIWDPDLNGWPQHISVTGDLVYLCGSFSTVGGVDTGGVARVGATGSGTLDQTWTPDLPSSSLETKVVQPVDGLVLYGGKFRVVGGESVSRVAAVDANGDLVYGFDPGNGPNDTVSALATDGTTLYLGGAFSEIDGNSRSKIAALDAATGQLSNWASNAGIEEFGEVKDLVLDSGNHVLYVGGSFMQVGGSDRYGLAALLTSDGGTVTDWGNGVLQVGADVMAMDMKDGGEYIYVGGDFTDAQFGGNSYNLVAVDPSGLMDNTFPSVQEAGNVKALDYTDGKLTVGGSFDSVGGTSVSNLAAINTEDKSVDGWAPNPDDTVTAVYVADGVVYVGGSFIYMSFDEETATGGLATLDVNGGYTTPMWGPSLNRVDTQSAVPTAIVPGTDSVWIGATSSITNEGTGRQFLLNTQSVLTAAPPTDVTAIRGSASGDITLTWAAPTSTGTGGAVTGYRIWSSPAPFETWSVAVHNTFSGDTSTTIDGLTNGTKYRFKVAAITAAGTGVASAPSNWARAEDPTLLPGAPESVTAVGVPVGTIDVEIEQPASWGSGATGKAWRGVAWINDVPMGYCQNIGAPVADWACTITGLTQEDNYDVSAMALNSLNKWGPPRPAEGQVMALSIFPGDPSPTPSIPEPQSADPSPVRTPAPTRQLPRKALSPTTVTRVDVKRLAKKRKRLMIRVTVHPAGGRIVALQRKACTTSAIERVCLWRTVRTVRSDRTMTDRVRIRVPRHAGRSQWRVFVPPTHSAAAAVTRTVRG